MSIGGMYCYWCVLYSHTGMTHIKGEQLLLISGCDESGSQQPRAILSHYPRIQFRIQVSARELCQSVYARNCSQVPISTTWSHAWCAACLYWKDHLCVCVCVCGVLCEKGDITVVHVCCCGSKQLGNHLLAYTSRCQDDEWTQLVKCMINYCYECWISCGTEVNQSPRCNERDYVTLNNKMFCCNAKTAYISYASE